jgi:hypothetical protein
LRNNKIVERIVAVVRASFGDDSSTTTTNTTPATTTLHGIAPLRLPSPEVATSTPQEQASQNVAQKVALPPPVEAVKSLSAEYDLSRKARAERRSNDDTKSKSKKRTKHGGVQDQVIVQRRHHSTHHYPSSYFRLPIRKSC